MKEGFQINCNMRCTPLEIEILMQVYYKKNFHWDTLKNYNRNALSKLKMEGLIVDYSSEMIEITDKGIAMVEHLCNIPLPKSKWVWE